MARVCSDGWRCSCVRVPSLSLSTNARLWHTDRIHIHIKKKKHTQIIIIINQIITSRLAACIRSIHSFISFYFFVAAKIARNTRKIVNVHSIIRRNLYWFCFGWFFAFYVLATNGQSKCGRCINLYDGWTFWIYGGVQSGQPFSM